MNQPLTDPSDRIVVIERTFDFRREDVFDAWTSPDLLARWFAPPGCTLHFARIDVRPGGGFHACVSNPEFGACWTVAVYTEVLRPERIVFRWWTADEHGNAVSPQSQGHDPDWPPETLVSVTFSEQDGRTTVVLTQNVSESLAQRTGAYPSWVQMLNLLSQTLHGLRASEPGR